MPDACGWVALLKQKSMMIVIAIWYFSGLAIILASLLFFRVLTLVSLIQSVAWPFVGGWLAVRYLRDIFGI